MADNPKGFDDPVFNGWELILVSHARTLIPSLIFSGTSRDLTATPIPIPRSTSDRCHHVDQPWTAMFLAALVHSYTLDRTGSAPRLSYVC